VTRLVLPLLVLFALNANAASVRLIDAVKNRDKAAIRSLVQQRVDVNASEADGTTALHWASRADDLETAELLIRAGANVKAKNRYGMTPLYLACTNGNAAMVEMLLKAGADPNAPVLSRGETALMMAARTGHLDAVKLLVERGARLDATETLRGTNALMWAAEQSHAEAVAVLTRHGADVNAVTNPDTRNSRLNIAPTVQQRAAQDVNFGQRRGGRRGAAGSVLSGVELHASSRPARRGRGKDRFS